MEEDSNLASEAALEVMVEMAKSKVGRPLDFNDVERLKSIMMTDREPVTEGNRNTRPRGPKSGINDHGAEMLSQMMTNLGSDISPTEVQIGKEELCLKKYDCFTTNTQILAIL